MFQEFLTYQRFEIHGRIDLKPPGLIWTHTFDDKQEAFCYWNVNTDEDNWREVERLNFFTRTLWTYRFTGKKLKRENVVQSKNKSPRFFIKWRSTIFFDIDLKIST